MKAELATWPSEAEARRVCEWQRLYEWIYGELAPDGDAVRQGSADLVGWRSSYTKAPYSYEEMADWREATTRRIEALSPRRVLEIGVGSGMLVADLATRVEEYLATDFSGAALERLAARVSDDESMAGRVRLEEREADDFVGLPRGHFDTVILNSVAQYFPSEQYFRRVLAGALASLRTGGAVFIGDVRDLRLHRAFRTGVLIDEIEAAEDAVAARDLVDDSVAAECELLVHPGFFVGLPGAGAVDIRLKRARFVNEMSAHRYDVVVFRKKAPVLPARAASVIRWSADGGLNEVARALASGEALRITGLPNARVLKEIEAERLLDAMASPAQVARAIRGVDAVAPVPDPERLCELGDQHGFETVVTWSGMDMPGTLDVVFVKPGPKHRLAVTPPGPLPEVSANDPMKRRSA